MKRIVVLCTGNSARSQMAIQMTGWLGLGRDEIKVYSEQFTRKNA